MFEQLSALLVGEARQAAGAEPGRHRLAQRENVAPRGRGQRHRRQQESERAPCSSLTGCAARPAASRGSSPTAGAGGVLPSSRPGRT